MAMALCPGWARADPETPRPVCRLESVVDVMAQQVRARWHYAWISPALIQEAPSPIDAVVRCRTCVDIGQYDTGRYGDQLVGRCEPHEFSVRAVRNGYVVRYLQ